MFSFHRQIIITINVKQLQVINSLYSVSLIHENCYNLNSQSFNFYLNVYNNNSQCIQCKQYHVKSPALM